jgi:hypothetical protein
VIEEGTLRRLIAHCRHARPWQIPCNALLYNYRMMAVQMPQSWNVLMKEVPYDA